MFGWLLEVVNSGVVDSPTNNFTGNSAEINIGNNNKLFVLIGIFIVLFVSAIIFFYIHNKKKIQNLHTEHKKSE